MNLKRSINRVASFLRTGVDFERLKIMYQENPEDVLLRSDYIRQCLRINENPEIYIKWVKDRYNLDIDLDANKWDFSSKLKRDLNFLSGVYAPNLEDLDLGGNWISSLEGLSGFNAPNLNFLNLSDNRIESLEGLSGLTAPSLLTLYLSDNKISSLRGLSGLNAPDLRLLELDNNRIKSLEGLQGWNAHNLDELVLYSNPIAIDMPYEDRKRFPFIVSN